MSLAVCENGYTLMSHISLRTTATDVKIKPTTRIRYISNIIYDPKLGLKWSFKCSHLFYLEKSSSLTFLQNTDNVIDIYISFYTTAVLNSMIEAIID